MKQTQEFDGKNVDSAVEKACMALNIAKKNLIYDVISSGSTGIFGIVGVKKARIRVTLPVKKDDGDYTQSQSYENDRAGIMSIVDEAFGKDSKQIESFDDSSDKDNFHSSSSDKETQESHLNTTTQFSKNIDNVAINAQISDETIEIKKQSERKKHADNRKKNLNSDISEAETDKSTSENISTAKPISSRSRRGKLSAKRASSVKNTNNYPNDKYSDQKTTDDRPAEHREKAISKKQIKGKSGVGKSDTVKPYSRKSRPKKRDTWLRADSDDALNEAVAAMENPDSNVLTSKGTTEEQNRQTKKYKKIENSEILNSLEDQYKIDLEDEFLDEDFHGGIEANSEGDDDPYIKDDDEILEVFDERDDGYPPKYKGEIPVDVSEDAMRVGRETLQKMVSLITDDAIVTAQSDEDRLLLKVEGGNSGVLIGRRGQTLEAMQYLTDKIINRYSESRVRLKVDIEGYMETRKANLKTLAYKMADKAKKTGKPATINQMTAQDRRVIHLALKDDTRVRTQSMGDGYYRRLVIFPKKSSFKRRKPFKK